MRSFNVVTLIIPELYFMMVYLMYLMYFIFYFLGFRHRTVSSLDSLRVDPPSILHPSDHPSDRPSDAKLSLMSYYPALNTF